MVVGIGSWGWWRQWWWEWGHGGGGDDGGDEVMGVKVMVVRMRSWG